VGASSNPHASSISATTIAEAITLIKKNREHVTYFRYFLNKRMEWWKHKN